MCGLVIERSKRLVELSGRIANLDDGLMTTLLDFLGGFDITLLTEMPAGNEVSGLTIVAVGPDCFGKCSSYGKKGIAHSG